MDTFDKYFYYQNAVQSPENDAEFLEETYEEIKGKKPSILREDFCAAFALCCEWVKRDPNFKAYGIDIDPEPLNYGYKNYLKELEEHEKVRVHVLEQDVMFDNPELPKADVIAALNFSYFGFKKRQQLLDYFKASFQALSSDGILVLDCFGGPSCMEPNIHETEFEDFSYYWDQDSYNPLTNEAQFYIHFKRKGEAKREKVFSYDWRLWSLAELKDIAEQAGFQKSHIYWEGTDDDGEGNGEFERTTTGEICDAWVAYLVAEK